MSSTKWMRTLSVLGLAFALAIVPFVILVSERDLIAQAWPTTENNPNAVCTPTGASCSVCGVGITWGCTSAIPVQWSAGNCVGPSNVGCTFSIFSCGPMYRCTSGMPNGMNCPSPNICQ